MNFRAIFPLVDFNDEFKFEQCQTNEEFLQEIVKIYFSNPDQRIQEAALSVYMAYRDHYPRYLNALSTHEIDELDQKIQNSTGKIIKLRRITLSALTKVAG